MRFSRFLVPLCLSVVAAFAQPPSPVDSATARLEERIGKAPASLASQFRSMAAKALQARHSDLAAKLAGTGGQPAPAPRPASGNRADLAPEVRTIQQRMGTMRGLPTDADRAKLATDLAAAIDALPAGPLKLAQARSLACLVTEGDLGKPALTAVAKALAQAAHDTVPDANDYLELANLVRYERITLPESNPALEAAGALLALREALVQENGFTLTGLDGHTYSLSALRGRVVLLNFWATWCPPCRKEMPDMEKLYRSFAARGLVILGVSDENRETVEKFLQGRGYTFPIALDPERKVNAAFSVEGIPKSFLFDREGNLVAQAIDMRTEAQFLEMFKQAGLE